MEKSNILPKKRPLENNNNNENPNLEMNNNNKNPKLENVSKKRVPLGDLTNRVLLNHNNNNNFRNGKNSKKQNKLQVNKIDEPLQKQFDEKSEIITSFEVQNVCDYGSDIYKHLRALEVEEKRRPLADYMEKVQKDVNVAMREILLDWLVEVAEEYNLVPDTLHLTVSFIDKFLSQNSIIRNKLQLLGVSSMLVASKYEEMTPPHVEDFCYITDYTYSREEVVNMEIDVLKCVDFKIGTPTIKTFLRIFTRVAQETPELCDMKMEFLGYYLAELSLLDYGCLRFYPSMIAASVIFLSRFIIQPKMNPWSSALQRCSGYRPSELKECVLAVHALPSSSRAKSFQAVTGKYTQHKFKCVASLPCPSEIPASCFEDMDE